MMYSRKFNPGSGADSSGNGMIPPDYGGVAYRNEAMYPSSEERDGAKRPRRALYKETDPPNDPAPVSPSMPIERHRERSDQPIRPRHRRYDTAQSEYSAPGYRHAPISNRPYGESDDPHVGNGSFDRNPPGADLVEYAPATPYRDRPAEYAQDDGEEIPRGKSTDDSETHKHGGRKDAEKKGGFLPGLSRLTKHSFTLEDILLAGILLLLLNEDGDSDLLLILGFLLLTGI